MKTGNIIAIISGIFVCLGVCQSSAETLMSGKIEATRVYSDPLQIELVEAIKSKNYDHADSILNKLHLDKAAEHGETVLWWQVNVGDFDGFSYLLEKGANIMRQVSDGPNILELCAMREDRRFIEEAVKRGVNLNMIGQYSRETPIFSAILHRQYNNVKFMLDKGAYCDVADAMGTTPALLAADQRAYDIVVLLLKSGANPRIKNRQGYNVLRSLSEKKVILGEPDYDAYNTAMQLAKG